MKKMLWRLRILVMTMALVAGVFTVNSVITEAKVKTGTVKSVGTPSTKTGGDFIKGVNKIQVTYKIAGKKSNVNFKVLDYNGKAIYKKIIKNCAPNKSYVATWDGKIGKEYASTGYYKIQISIGKSVIETEEFKFYQKSDFTGGDGSISKPYKITSFSDFKLMPAHPERNFYLANDLDANYDAFQGIFNSSSPLEGTFDGKGHTISNVLNTEAMFGGIGEKGIIKNLNVAGLVCIAKEQAGFVYENKGEINNISLTDVSVTGAHLAAIAYKNDGTIKSCSVEGEISTDTGAPVARYNNKTGKVLDCETNVVISNGDATTNYIGGIVEYNYGLVKSCKADGSIDNKKGSVSHCGTIIGRNEGTMMDCYFLGTTAEDYKAIGTDKGIVK